MPALQASFQSGWLSLDAWSETYIGAHWLSVQELPPVQWQAEPRHSPLSKLLLIASHHLVEIMLFNSLRTLAARLADNARHGTNRLSRVPFDEALKKWPQALTGKAFDLTREPFASVTRLQQRRNATIHSESALTSLPMARSALHSAVAASREIAEQLLGPGAFKYDPVLAKYPLTPQPWFSGIAFLERFPVQPKPAY